MENRKHTSLKDLAQALGVSIPTVSRALKDSPETLRQSQEAGQRDELSSQSFRYESAKECAAHHRSDRSGYCHSFLCLHSERDREHGDR